MSFTPVCDFCGLAVPNARWALPPGWTGASLGATRPVDYTPIHRCDECWDAINQAVAGALEKRRQLKESRP